MVEEVCQQKRTVRKTERIWKQHKKNYQWKVLCLERRKYRLLIKETKRKLLSEKIKQADRSTKELYRVFNNTTGMRKENPMPDNQTDQDLADMFAIYFFGKNRDNKGGFE